MNKTKKKILETSLDLFNTLGVASVSQRKITEVLKISPGNLTYHFKKKEDIKYALYLELVATIDREMMSKNSQGISLEVFFDLVDMIMNTFFEYRFVFLDFRQIMSANSKIAAHYMELCKLRKYQFQEFITQLIAVDILRKEELPNEYEYVYTRIHILMDFWISSVMITESQITKDMVVKYKNIILHAIYPYLTASSKQTFITLMNTSGK